MTDGSSSGVKGLVDEAIGKDGSEPATAQAWPSLGQIVGKPSRAEPLAHTIPATTEPPLSGTKSRTQRDAHLRRFNRWLIPTHIHVYSVRLPAQEDPVGPMCPVLSGRVTVIEHGRGSVGADRDRVG